MFLTHRAAFIDSQGLEDGIFHWSCVEHSLNLPWFYISLTKTTAQGALMTMLQTMDPSILAVCTTKHPDDVSVREVMLVSPSHLNGTGTWRMEKLMDYARYHSETVGSFDVFKVEGGRIYSTNGGAAMNVTGDAERTVFYSAAKLDCKH